MFGRKRQPEPPAPAEDKGPSLKDAIREARIESAERSGVVVDLRDAELARLELLNEQLDPLFADIPHDVELFDRGISRGDTPRLWVDAVAHVAMGRDKRMYRFVQDTRVGRKVLAESFDIPEIAKAVMRYVARRMVERERALAGDSSSGQFAREAKAMPRGRWRTARMFLLGLIIGIAAVLLAAWLLSGPTIP